MPIDYERARQLMVEQQVRTWEVLDQRVLDVMSRTPREDFVPERYRAVAFADMQIPLPHGQVMMQPKVEGRMLQALAVRPGDRVLEIGTGTGYVTALLAGLGGEVVSVDIFEEFTAGARTRLGRLGLDRCRLATGDAVAGWPEAPACDAIAVTGSYPQELPDALLEQLAVGGRLFAVVGEGPLMEALLVRRVGEREWLREALFETTLPPLIGASRRRAFVL